MTSFASIGGIGVLARYFRQPGIQYSVGSDRSYAPIFAARKFDPLFGLKSQLFGSRSSSKRTFAELADGAMFIPVAGSKPASTADVLVELAPPPARPLKYSIALPLMTLFIPSNVVAMRTPLLSVTQHVSGELVHIVAAQMHLPSYSSELSTQFSTRRSGNGLAVLPASSPVPNTTLR